jgi:hypothetical protein
VGFEAKPYAERHWLAHLSCKGFPFAEQCVSGGSSYIMPIAAGMPSKDTRQIPERVVLHSTCFAGGLPHEWTQPTP